MKTLVVTVAAALTLLLGNVASAIPIAPPPNPDRLPVSRYWPPADSLPAIPSSVWEFHLTPAYWEAFRVCLTEASFETCRGSVPADYEAGVRVR